MQRNTSLQPVAASPAREGRLSISVDTGRNLIRVVGEGFWTAEYVANHIREFEAVLLRARSSPVPSRTIVDLRNAPVQSPEVAAKLHEAMVRMYRAPERAAIVVGSSLVKMQMKRGFDPKTHAVFLSFSAAETWLSAYDYQHPNGGANEKLW